MVSCVPSKTGRGFGAARNNTGSWLYHVHPLPFHEGFSTRTGGAFLVAAAATESVRGPQEVGVVLRGNH